MIDLTSPSIEPEDNIIQDNIYGDNHEDKHAQGAGKQKEGQINASKKGSYAPGRKSKEGTDQPPSVRAQDTINIVDNNKSRAPSRQEGNKSIQDNDSWKTINPSLKNRRERNRDKTLESNNINQYETMDDFAEIMHAVARL